MDYSSSRARFIVILNQCMYVYISNFHLLVLNPLSSITIRHGKYAFSPPPFMCVNYSLVVIDKSQNKESQNNSGVILQLAQSITSKRQLSVSGY